MVICSVFSIFFHILFLFYFITEMVGDDDVTHTFFPFSIFFGWFVEIHELEPKHFSKCCCVYF